MYKKTTEELISDLKKSLEGTNVDEIKDKTAKLNEKAMEYATRIYQEQAAQNQNNGGNNSSDDGASEAEFVNK